GLGRDGLRRRRRRAHVRRRRCRRAARRRLAPRLARGAGHGRRGDRACAPDRRRRADGLRIRRRRRHRERRRRRQVARDRRDVHAGCSAQEGPRARDPPCARAVGRRARLPTRRPPGRVDEPCRTRALRRRRLPSEPRVPLPRRSLSATAWVASLSPWPEEFGLDRMRRLLAALGDPQRAFPAVHVVGTNGKTAARTVAALLRAEGLDVGAYTSPHVSGWHERLDTDPETFERAVARVRPHAEMLGATQFEVLTAAALAEFAARGVAAAVVEAGLGGRLDATNVLDARVVLLTNVSLEHTDVLGDTRDAIAREKLAVARPPATVVLGEPEWAPLVPPGCEVVAGGAHEAAEAFLGRPLEREVEIRVPGRLDWRGPGELWDGAHNPAGAEWLLGRL